MKRPSGLTAHLGSSLTPSGEYSEIQSSEMSESDSETSWQAEVDPWGSESDLWRRQDHEEELPEFEIDELTPSLVPIRFTHNRLAQIPQLDDVSITTSQRFGVQQNWAGDELGGAEVFHRIREHLSIPPSAQPSTLKPQGIFEVSVPPEGHWYGDEEDDLSLARMKSTRPVPIIAPVHRVYPSTKPARPKRVSTSIHPKASPSLTQLEFRQLEHDRNEAQRREIQRLKEEKFEEKRLEEERRRIKQREAERLEAERLEVERLEAELLEAERLEAELLEAERLEAELLEAERLAVEEQLEKQLLSRMSAEEVISFTFGLNQDAFYEPHHELHSMPPLSPYLIKAVDPESDLSHQNSTSQDFILVPNEIGEDDETQPPLRAHPKVVHTSEMADLFHTDRQKAQLIIEHPPTLRLRHLRKGGLIRIRAQGSHSAICRALPLISIDGVEHLLSLRPLRPLYEVGQDS